jgi:hypothetical protein
MFLMAKLADESSIARVEFIFTKRVGRLEGKTVSSRINSSLISELPEHAGSEESRLL